MVDEDDTLPLYADEMALSNDLDQLNEMENENFLGASSLEKPASELYVSTLMIFYSIFSITKKYHLRYPKYALVCNLLFFFLCLFLRGVLINLYSKVANLIPKMFAHYHTINYIHIHVHKLTQKYHTLFQECVFQVYTIFLYIYKAPIFRPVRYLVL